MMVKQGNCAIEKKKTYTEIRRVETNAGLVKLASDLDVAGRSHKLNAFESASWHDASTVTGLGAVTAHLVSFVKWTRLIRKHTQQPRLPRCQSRRWKWENPTGKSLD